MAAASSRLKLSAARTRATCGCGECLVNSHCYFSGVDPSERATIEERLIANRYKKNQVIAHEGVRPHGVFLLCSGQAKVCKTDESGHQLAVRLGRAGTLVGYRSLLLDEPFSATVEATELSVVTFLDREYFFDLLKRQPTLMMRLIRQLAEQVGQAEEIALTMAYHGSYRRVAEILAVAVRGHTPRLDNLPVPLPPIRRQDLAQRAGLALETTIRILKDMEDRGFIRLKGRQITVLNPRKIDELVDSEA
ncbi:MAG: Crp/Fnr family transcriptional regulator [Nitrospirae bacterium]|nr:Crp/Fnr family transcriptional regulator [Nitrospirota bacterium]